MTPARSMKSLLLWVCPERIAIELDDFQGTEKVGISQLRPNTADYREGKQCSNGILNLESIFVIFLRESQFVFLLALL